MIKPKMSRIKKRVIKKVNVMNSTIIIVCIFVGYAIVSFLSLSQGVSNNSSTLEDIKQATNRIADSFELYNQKKFSDHAQ